MVRNDILRYYPQAEEKIVVIHNGVEWHEFSDAFEEKMIKKEGLLTTLGLNTDSFYYLFLGSGYRRKGLKKAIAALRLLPEHVELLVVGKDKNENEYKSLAEKIGLMKRIHFFGPQKHVIQFYQVSDAFILPTIYDPFSNASLEALAMGLYTVTSKANGCSEVIGDGAGYIIADLKDISSVAEAMKKALDNHLSKEEIRESVKYLDFSNQLKKIVDICLSDSK
jgi:UDP-glucose:(heptosyl)LPS alpha-1,3-glucosyltransferase